MSNKPTNLRLPTSLHDKLSDAAKRMDLPIADVMRQCLALGLADLALVNFDLDSVIHQAVMAARTSNESNAQK